MLINSQPTMEETLQEMTQNSYDLLGDIIAAQCLCSCANLQDCYSADIIVCYRTRIADYIKQHSSELTLLAARAVVQLTSVGDSL